MAGGGAYGIVDLLQGLSTGGGGDDGLWEMLDALQVLQEAAAETPQLAGSATAPAAPAGAEHPAAADAAAADAPPTDAGTADAGTADVAATTDAAATTDVAATTEAAATTDAAATEVAATEVAATEVAMETRSAEEAEVTPAGGAATGSGQRTVKPFARPPSGGTARTDEGSVGGAAPTGDGSVRGGRRENERAADGDARAARIQKRRARDKLYDQFAASHQRAVGQQLTQPAPPLPHSVLREVSANRFAGLAPLLLAADVREDRSLWRGLWHLRRAANRRRPPDVDAMRRKRRHELSPATVVQRRSRSSPTPALRPLRNADRAPLYRDGRSIQFIRLLFGVTQQDAANKQAQAADLAPGWWLQPEHRRRLPHLHCLAVMHDERLHRQRAARTARASRRKEEAQIPRTRAPRTREQLHPVWSWERRRAVEQGRDPAELEAAARVPVRRVARLDAGPAVPHRTHAQQPHAAGSAAALLLQRKQAAKSDGTVTASAAAPAATQPAATLSLAAADERLLASLDEQSRAAGQRKNEGPRQRAHAETDARRIAAYDSWLRSTHAVD
eukprot:TRINITY_DN12431_c0_g1_i1.p1 TRINITY_DN12431_c0_g1~~TRINITY_DN12431_c0_g1_i1.p1  ORF type:complete len:577 (+),score=134.52 TRINITY_DN12431_c0_g1_i1:51-1733(+)